MRENWGADVSPDLPTEQAVKEMAAFPVRFERTSEVESGYSRLCSELFEATLVEHSQTRQPLKIINFH
jgi:hypothetical protein